MYTSHKSKSLSKVYSERCQKMAVGSCRSRDIIRFKKTRKSIQSSRHRHPAHRSLHISMLLISSRGKTLPLLFANTAYGNTDAALLHNRQWSRHKSFETMDITPKGMNKEVRDDGMYANHTYQQHQRWGFAVSIESSIKWQRSGLDINPMKGQTNDEVSFGYNWSYVIYYHLWCNSNSHHVLLTVHLDKPIRNNQQHATINH